MMRSSLLALLLAAVVLPTGVAQAAHEAEHGAGAAASGAEAPARSNRLRFRNGPVCMCTLGMSEEDIQRAQSERRRKGQ
jgi:hypothetical protein